METLFDYVTVACFLAMSGAYLMLTTRQPRTLVHLLLAGIAFAIANQLGNDGHAIFGSLLIVAGTAYAIVIIRQG
jgi:hypothetical protein